MIEKHFNFVTDKNLMRGMVVLIFILAMVGGYYHAQLQTRERLYKNLERKYQLLQEKTQQ